MFNSDAVLNTTTREEFLKVPDVTPASNYAAGILVIPAGNTGEWVYRHDGKDPGYQAMMTYSTLKDTAIALCVSGSQGGFDEIYGRLVSDVLSSLEN